MKGKTIISRRKKKGPWLVSVVRKVKKSRGVKLEPLKDDKDDEVEPEVVVIISPTEVAAELIVVDISSSSEEGEEIEAIVVTSAVEQEALESPAVVDQGAFGKRVRYGFPMDADGCDEDVVNYCKKHHFGSFAFVCFSFVKISKPKIFFSCWLCLLIICYWCSLTLF